jgi:hypothetical protein
MTEKHTWAIATPSNPLEILVQQQQDALVHFKVDTYLSFFDPGVEFADASLDNVLHGVANVRVAVEAMVADFNFACDYVVFVDQHYFTVKPVGPLFGKTPPLARVVMISTLRFHKLDNTDLYLSGVDMFEFGSDNKIVRLTSFYDPKVLGQLGKGVPRGG